MDQEAVARLQQTPLFGALKTESIVAVLGEEGPFCVPTGQDLFVEGEPVYAMFFLASGRAAILKGAQKRCLGEFGAGDCFGETSLINLQPRSATIQALMPCTAIEIPLAGLDALRRYNLNEFALLPMNMERELSRRLRAAEARLLETSSAALPGVV